MSNNIIAPFFFVSSGLPSVTAEYRFHPVRKWKFDYAWPAHQVALEVEGGAFIQGRHTRGAGFIKDLEKYSTAASMGWLVIRCTPQQLMTEQTVKFVAEAIKSNTRKAV